MGKRYLCEYCNKTMSSSPAIVKEHNSGLMHQKLVQEHYRQFKDPEEILAEESGKKPCNRFLNGACQFGALCRYSHYSHDQITALREMVAAKTSPISEFQQPSFEELYQKLQLDKKGKAQQTEENTTVIYDSNGVTHILPWVYNDAFESCGDALPPSLRRINIEDMSGYELSEWG